VDDSKTFGACPSNLQQSREQKDVRVQIANSRPAQYSPKKQNKIKHGISCLAFGKRSNIRHIDKVLMESARTKDLPFPLMQ
jgi:hypothetical protein